MRLPSNQIGLVFLVVGLVGCGGVTGATGTGGSPGTAGTTGAAGTGGTTGTAGTAGTTGTGGTTGAGGTTGTAGTTDTGGTGGTGGTAGACASLGACACMQAGDRCVARTEACWCPSECDPQIVCVCGGGRFLACEDKPVVPSCTGRPHGRPGQMCGPALRQLHRRLLFDRDRPDLRRRLPGEAEQHRIVRGDRLRLLHGVRLRRARDAVTVCGLPPDLQAAVTQLTCRRLP